jgi:hypothetical protein
MTSASCGPYRQYAIQQALSGHDRRLTSSLTKLALPPPKPKK